MHCAATENAVRGATADEMGQNPSVLTHNLPDEIYGIIVDFLSVDDAQRASYICKLASDLTRPRLIRHTMLSTTTHIYNCAVGLLSKEILRNTIISLNIDWDPWTFQARPLSHTQLLDRTIESYPQHVQQLYDSPFLWALALVAVILDHAPRLIQLQTTRWALSRCILPSINGPMRSETLYSGLKTVRKLTINSQNHIIPNGYEWETLPTLSLLPELTVCHLYDAPIDRGRRDEEQSGLSTTRGLKVLTVTGDSRVIQRISEWLWSEPASLHAFEYQPNSMSSAFPLWDCIRPLSRHSNLTRLVLNERTVFAMGSTYEKVFRVPVHMLQRLEHLECCGPRLIDEGRHGVDDEPEIMALLDEEEEEEDEEPPPLMDMSHRYVPEHYSKPEASLESVDPPTTNRFPMSVFDRTQFGLRGGNAAETDAAEQPEEPTIVIMPRMSLGVAAALAPNTRAFIDLSATWNRTSIMQHSSRTAHPNLPITSLPDILPASIRVMILAVTRIGNRELVRDVMVHARAQGRLPNLEEVSVEYASAVLEAKVQKASVSIRTQTRI